MKTSPSMQSLVQAYLEDRRRLGFSLTISGGQLMAFARFADRQDYRGPLTEKLIMEWAQGAATKATPMTWARRLEILRPFARYLAARDPATFVPDKNRFGRAHRRLTPHIYSDQEIGDLLAATDRLSPPGTLRSASYRTLFGLIAATGLRISEALRLRCADVDLADGLLTIRQTKCRKSRLVPLHPTVTQELAAYASLPQRMVPLLSDQPFLVSESGSRLVNRTVHGVFQQLRTQLGWSARGTHPQVRIHDLRHTFICRRVQRWHRQGANIDNAMLALATYVGHAKVSDTYWYLTGIPELLALAGNRFEGFTQAFEEVRHA